MTVYEKFLNKVYDSTIGTKYREQIKNIELQTSLSSATQAIADAVADGQGSFLIKDPLGEADLLFIDGSALKATLDSDSDKIFPSGVRYDGSDDGYTYVRDLEIIVQQMAEEYDQAVVASKILSVITSVSDDTSYEVFTSSLRDACASAATAAGQTLGSLISIAVNQTSSVQDLIKVIGTFLAPGAASDQDVFAPSQAGSATNTSGILLWANAILEDFEDFMDVIIPKVTSIGQAFQSLFVYGSLWLGDQISTILSKIPYWLSNLFGDEFVNSSPNAQSLAFNNGFIDVCPVDQDLIPVLNNIGVNRTSAIMIPSLGADWYFYVNSSGQYRAGMVKHLYTQSSAILLRNRISQTGNTPEDVVKMYGPTSMVRGFSDPAGKYVSVEQANSDWAFSLGHSESLISYGLLMIGGIDPTNRYYQDADSAVSSDYKWMWSPYYNYSSKEPGYMFASANRSEFVHEATHLCEAASTKIQLLVNDSLRGYLNSYNQGSIRVKHIYVSNTLPGYVNIMDDALTVSTIATQINNVLAIGATITVATILITSIVKLKTVARNASIIAARAVADGSTPVDTARRLGTRAKWLNFIAGIPTGTALTPISGINISRDDDILNYILSSIRP